MNLFRVQTGMGILGPKQRIVAWVGFFALTAYGIFLAYSAAGLKEYGLPPDTWMLSVTVAGLIAFVLIVDDVERRKSRRTATLDEPPTEV
jgi:hypothetical protein